MIIMYNPGDLVYYMENNTVKYGIVMAVTGDVTRLRGLGWFKSKNLFSSEAALAEHLFPTLWYKKRINFKLFEVIFFLIQSYILFKLWIIARKNQTEEGYGPCYCGHTDICPCGDPDLSLFRYNLRNRNIDFTDLY